MRVPSPASCFIRKPFADIVPDDFNDYIDDRCQSVEAPTVDREIDLFSAACRMAIDTWRIPVAKSPMDGIMRPKYFNERDRRLKNDEESRLLSATYNEDAQKSIEQRLEELMHCERAASTEAATKYRRKNIIKDARALHLPEAEASYSHTPWPEAFIQFQLMTAARRSETMSLTWDNIDFCQQTAFIPESKNGRPRKLALRKDSEHDATLSMSSGQLSALSLSFFLSLNRVYSENAFVLIDDPAQSLDEINIASLTDLLRCELRDRQLIISSHEDDIAGYMRYRFDRAGLSHKLFHMQSHAAGTLQPV